MGTEQRKLAAIMFTDMVGYSALAQRNEALALAVLDAHHRLLRPLFPSFGGREIKTTGDGFLVEFASALEAAQCAIEIQKAIAAHNATVPPERRFRVRIGVHVGDVVLRESDVYGDGVNIAARIEPLAEAGGICLSRPVVDQIANKIDSPLIKLGSPELKNIKVPVEVYRLVLPWEQASGEIRNPKSEIRTKQNILMLATRPRWWLTALVALVLILAAWAAWWFVRHGAAWSSNKAAARITSLAVKPLDDFSGDTNQAYLSDGMTEALCSALGNISVLRVPGRSSVMRYKGGQKSIREMAGELNVDAIVEGSVQRAGNRLLITAQLIEAATDRHLWSTNYERDLSDFFKVQSEVARAIAGEVQVRLTPEDQARLARARAAHPDAVEAYLRGMHHWWQWSEQDSRSALQYFNRAIAIEPNFAAAHTGVALTYCWNSGGLWPRQEADLKAKAAAQRAIELDPMLAEAYVARGAARVVYDWDWVGGENDLRRGLELSPHSSLALANYTGFLVMRGRFDEALVMAKRAVESDPLSPGANTDLGVTYYLAGRPALAFPHFRKALELDSKFFQAHLYEGLCYLLTGESTKALPELKIAEQLAPDSILSQMALGHAYGVTGQPAEAQKLLANLDRLAQKRSISPTAWVFVHVGLGQTNAALEWLEKACRERDTEIPWTLVDPRLSSLRNEPRFQALRQRVENGGRAP